MSNTQIHQERKEEEETTSATVAAVKAAARSVQVPQTSDVSEGGMKSSSSSGNAEKAAAALERIVRLFSTKELHRTVATVYIHTAGRPCEGRSIGNLLPMYLAGTKDARTHTAWQRARRYVKKGARATSSQVGTTECGAKKEFPSQAGSTQTLVGFSCLSISDGTTKSYFLLYPDRKLYSVPQGVRFSCIQGTSALHIH